MRTRNGLTYGENFSNVEQKKQTLYLDPPIHFLQKVELKTESLGLAPPFPKVELKVDINFDEASTAWKLNKKSIGNGCYKYVCVKVKKMDINVKMIV